MSSLPAVLEPLLAPSSDARAELLGGPDPEAALRRASALPKRLLERLFANEELAHSRAAIALLHQGSYPARLMGLLAPEVVAEVLAPNAPTQLDLPALFDDALAKYAPAEAIARVRTRAYLHLARREIEHAPLEEIGGELSQLASACANAALASVAPELCEQICVFGMGKLGGYELNFLSDIDLVFVHADEAVAAPDETRVHRLRTQLHQQLRRVVRLLEGSGVWRPLFHVDLRLRPFGSRGPLSLSLSALERYYERHGRSWERQAWLRARPIAGNHALGELALERLAPFVWPRSSSPASFDEIVDMMKRARSQAHASIGRANVDLKHDPGGIREIEFFVQSLQLLNGGRNPNVRTRSTLGACDRLAAAGLLSDREHEILARAYRVLRRIEHRVQLAEGQQTHRVPGEAAPRELLARRLAVGAPPTWLIGAERKLGPQAAPRPPNNLEDFDTGLAELRADVQTITATLTGETELADADLATRERAQAKLLDSGASPRTRIDALCQLGLSPDAAEEIEAMLVHLYAREQGVLTSSGASRSGASALLLACLDSADPVEAMRRFVEFAASRPAHFGVWRLMAQPEQGALVRQVADLFGTSEPLSRGLIGFGRSRAAKDGGLTLLLEASSGELPTPEQLRAHYLEFEAEQGPTADAEGTRDTPPLGRRLLLFKHRELVRIGLYDLARRPDPLAVGRSLSDLADLVVRELLAELADELRDTLPFELAVLTLGKFGMRAMDYGSDLDLMFVFRPGPGATPTTARDAAQRASRQLLARLEDRSGGLRLYEVDMRLRPSGRQGLLVSSLTGFRSYHARSLQVWERLALVRLRGVAEQHFGPRTDAQVGQDLSPGSRALPGPLCATILDEIIPGSVHDPDDTGHIAARTWELKQRIEAELARETREQWDIKTGVGGCLELELLVAALQLQHGVPTPEIPQALAQLAKSAVLTAEEAAQLDAAYRFSRRLLNRLRMSRGSGRGHSDRLTVNSPRLTALARRMGLADRDALLSTLTQERAKIRAAFARHLAHSHGGDH